jgi:hypothetical protein
MPRPASALPARPQARLPASRPREVGPGLAYGQAGEAARESGRAPREAAGEGEGDRAAL